MKCHYEVLGVERNAEDGEIKKKYRELALKYHPDKNLENAEESHEEFIIIQQAYHVLIDKQERAWYDKHREAILKGGLGDNYEDDSLDVFPYFTASCFKGFGDDEKGFYCVYGKVFETLAAQDLPFIDPDPGGGEVEKPPVFGLSHSDYNEVVNKFYGFWQSYCTKKTFAWLDKYDIRQAENRRVLRLMEKENKKVRDAAKRDRNEEVRQLVAFVRKRDKRVEKHRKELEEKAKQIQARVAEQKKLEREERLRKLEEYEGSGLVDADAVEATLQDLEKMYGDECVDGGSSGEEVGSNGKSGGMEEEVEDYNSLHCIACNKVFQSDKAFVNHEKSKKHRENVDNLRNELLCDEIGEVDLLEDGDSGGEREEEEMQTGNRKKLSKRQKKMKRQQQQQSCTGGSGDDECVVESGGDVDVDAGVDAGVDAAVDVDVDGGRDGVQDTVKPQQIIDGSSTQEPTARGPPPARSKKNQKKKNQTDQSKASIGDDADARPKASKCDACQADFPSRTRLFEHLKTTGHATIKQSNEKEKNKRKGKHR